MILVHLFLALIVAAILPFMYWHNNHSLEWNTLSKITIFWSIFLFWVTFTYSKHCSPWSDK